MDTKTFLIVLIPSVLSSIIAITSIISIMLREKRKKKEQIWNLTKELILKYKAEDFIHCYDVINIAKAFHYLNEALAVAGTDKIYEWVKSFEEKQKRNTEQQHC